MKTNHFYRALSVCRALSYYRALSAYKAISCYLICIILLSACTKAHHNNACTECGNVRVNSSILYSSHYICHNAKDYAGSVVADGHCVSFIKQCSTAPDTHKWRPGELVWRNNIKAGSVIATFKNGRYPNITGYHAAIYIRQDSQGIWVWDQWQGKAVHQRLIRWRNDNAADGNTAQSYRLVLSGNN